MGLSASQARLLSLTSRLSDLEFSAQQISNARIRLADETQEIAENYANALDKKKLTVATGINSAGATTYIDANAKLLTTYNAISTTDRQRLLKDANGKLIVTDSVAEAYDNSLNQLTGGVGRRSLALFLSNLGVVTNQNDSNYDATAVTYYTNVYNEINNGGGYNAPGDDNMNSSEWLYQQIQNGNIYLEVWNPTGGETGEGGFDSLAWNADASLVEQEDDATLAQAEAEYEAKSAEIQSKDKKLELNLKQVDTEHSAIQTEYDSVKSVMDKNIERSFKMFNG